MSDSEPIIANRDYEINLPPWVHDVKNSYHAAKMTLGQMRHDLEGKERNTFDDKGDYIKARKMFLEILTKAESYLPGFVPYDKETDDGDHVLFFIPKTREVYCLNTNRAYDLRYDPGDARFVGLSMVRQNMPHEVKIVPASFDEEEGDSLSKLSILDMARILDVSAINVSDENIKTLLRGIAGKLFEFDQGRIPALMEKQKNYGKQISERLYKFSKTLQRISDLNVPEWVFIQRLDMILPNVERKGLFYSPTRNILCDADVMEKRDWSNWGKKRLQPDMRQGYNYIYGEQNSGKWCEASNVPDRLIEEIVPQKYQAWIKQSS
jgi:hypothetical protein